MTKIKNTKQKATEDGAQKTDGGRGMTHHRRAKRESAEEIRDCKFTKATLEKDGLLT